LSCTNLYTFSRFWDIWSKFWLYMNMVCSCSVWTVKRFVVDVQYNIYCNTLVNGDQTGEQTSALNLHFMHDDKITQECTLKLDKFLLFQHYVGHLCCMWGIFDISETQHENEITIQVGNCRNTPGIRNIDSCRTKQKVVWLTLNITCTWDPVSGLGVNAAACLTNKETNLLYAAVFIQKLIVCQLAKKFPALCGRRRFITAFTRARHLSLSWGQIVPTLLLVHAFMACTRTALVNQLLLQICREVNCSLLNGIHR